MSLVGGWILAPLVLFAVICGCGLLAERLTRSSVPRAMIPPVGLGVLVVVAGPFTLLDVTAELAAPAVLVAAVAGIAWTRPWRAARLRPSAGIAVAVGTYAIYAAPSLLTGQGSITGYVKLDDSATFIAIADHIFEHGRQFSMLEPGTFARTVESNLLSSYPHGSFLPLGVTAALTGLDPVVVFQPIIAVFAAVLALGLFACVRAVGRTPATAALCALAAVQASLLFGYANWGGIKEVLAAAVIATLGFLAAGRQLALLAITAGALLAITGVSGLIWAGPALAAGAVLWWRGARTRPRRIGPLVALLIAASLPALVTVEFVRNAAAGGSLSSSGDIGNLIRPLSLLQGAGLWPVGDFRVKPDPIWPAVALSLVVVAAAYEGVRAAVARREWTIPVLLAIPVIGAAAAILVGSAWVDAKALAILSPFVLVTAVSLVVGWRRRYAIPATVAVLAATAWSTVLVCRDVFVAPHDRLAELAKIAEGARGPVVQLDFEIYGSRHYLREHSADGATDLRHRRVARTDGTLFAELSTAEVDEVAIAELWAFRGIVRRRNPVASRPPAAFSLETAGESFERWQRPAEAPAPLQRLPLSTGLDPTAQPDCAQVRALSQVPGVRELAAVERPAPVLVDLATAAVPPLWKTSGGVIPVSDGEAAVPVNVPAAGTWRVYVGGSALGRLEVLVDDRPVGVHRHELAHTGQWLRYGAVELGAGEHTVVLRYSAGFPQAGIGDPSSLGPLALAPEAAEAELPVLRVEPRRYRELCARRLDWVEALP